MEPKLEINSPEEQESLKDTAEEILENEAEKIENKPTPEEVEAAREEFESTAKSWSLKEWAIGSPEKGEEICEYLKHFMTNRFYWTSNAWMGLVKLHEELEKSLNIWKLDQASTGQEPLKISYQALEFAFHALQHPGGLGLEAALAFEGEIEQYKDILEILETVTTKAREELNKIQYLQERWAAMSQGFYLEQDAVDVPDEKLPEGAYFDEDANRYFVPGDDGYDIEKFGKISNEKNKN